MATATVQNDCDFSPMKEKLKEHLTQTNEQLGLLLSSLDRDGSCLLHEFEQIMNRFSQIKATAAAFYLRCYLSPYTDSYLALSTGIQHLSERRHGALIVIERNDPTESFMQKGIPVGAMFTHSLLESIFYPGSPLHDGAVLIKGNQIISAAHVLPHSTLYSGEKKLGTRHRAAIGMSEQTDALVIVVSEETGRASFALDGTLYPLAVID
ncbi:hypothetical protein EDM56_04020 [Brevibacillus fluminis]|uniref:Diadenylate cyclase n=1 Tax=Brevibacillus fluminis TaxID=511487 RepID=A0A3M8DV07_9BACL|nr:sporulation-specific diadenylate cyclase CdaS [Brevibacillus fluminis]RNB91926.1 hypothetical protein EDM56_04020 [Brevibacillus fluminis]